MVMQLIKEITIKDIRDYEIKNDVDTLSLLEAGELFVIQDLIQIGNKCSEDEASEILDKAISYFSNVFLKDTSSKSLNLLDSILPNIRSTSLVSSSKSCI